MKQKHISLNVSAGGEVVKNPSANAGDTGLFPGLGRSLGEGNPRQYSSGKYHGQRSLEDYSLWPKGPENINRYTVYLLY